MLYSTGIHGRKFKTQINRAAAERAEVIYEAAVRERQRPSESPSSKPYQSGKGFDPTRPQSVDWQKILEQVAREVSNSMPLKRYKLAKSAPVSEGEEKR
jgi:hypothetical protein